MMPDLQTDPQFPAFAEDADPASLRTEEFMVRDNDVADHLVNFPPTPIEDRRGRQFLALAQEIGDDGAPPPPWSLTVLDASIGKVRIELGDFIDDPSDLTAKAEISGDTEFTASAGHIARLRIDSLDPLSVSIESGPPWPQYPAAYELDGLLDATTLTAAYWPLWEFHGSPQPGSFAIRAGLHARRVAPETHLRGALALYRDPAGQRRPLPVPLLPEHAALLIAAPSP